jgi:hypothetical protein
VLLENVLGDHMCQFVWQTRPQLREHSHGRS